MYRWDEVLLRGDRDVKWSSSSSDDSTGVMVNGFGRGIDEGDFKKENVCLVVGEVRNVKFRGFYRFHQLSLLCKSQARD